MNRLLFILASIFFIVCAQAQTSVSSDPPMSFSDKLTIGNLVVTSIYSLLTLLILFANRSAVAAMKDQQHAAMRPYIDVAMTVRTSTNILRLSIKNTGKTQAIDLILKLDKDFFQFCNKADKNNLRLHPAFANQIKSFSPGAELLFDLGTGPEIYAAQDSEATCPHVFTVEAIYQVGKGMVIESSIIDLRPYIHSTIPIPPVAEEIANLRQEISLLRKAIK